MTRIAVLVSGRGSNLEAIIGACRRGEVAGEVAVVASNRECRAIEVARAEGVEIVRVFPQREFPDRSARDRAMAEVMLAAGVVLVVTAGYDRVLDEVFVAAFPGHILNVHPSLLPAFGGSMDAIEQAFAAGVSQTGVTVHFIEPNTIDAGTIAAHATVPIRSGDSLADIEARVHEAEHRLLPATIQAWIEGRVKSPAARPVAR